MISPKKSLGQNFITNIGVLDRICKALDLQSDDQVLEIGPGPGALTRFLLPYTNSYSAIEIDDRCIPILDELKAEYPFFQPISGDILKISLDPYKKCTKIVGNLPYNISTPIMERIALELNPDVIVCMFAQGTAERYTASVGTKNYSSGTVFMQSFFRIDTICSVKKGSFYPPPKIHSKVLRFFPLNVDRYEIFHFTKFVQRLFSFRRKTLFNALKNSFGNHVARNIELNHKKDLSRRPEMIPMEEFFEIYSIYMSTKHDY